MKIASPSNRPSRSQGFTLMEMIVSAGLGTSVILVMLMTVLTGTQGYSSATRRIDALVESRAALGALSDDTSTLLSLSSAEFGLVDNDDLFHEIYFYTLKPMEAQDRGKAVSDVCYVHYFTATTPDAPFEGAPISRKLYRRFLSSAEVLADLRNGALPEPKSEWESAEVVAFNVTAFQCQPFQKIDGELREWTTGEGSPSRLQIDLQIVDNETGSLLETEDDWKIESALARRLVASEGDLESRRGRDFSMMLEINHEG